MPSLIVHKSNLSRIGRHRQIPGFATFHFIAFNYDERVKENVFGGTSWGFRKCSFKLVKLDDGYNKQISECHGPKDYLGYEIVPVIKNAQCIIPEKYRAHGCP